MKSIEFLLLQAQHLNGLLLLLGLLLQVFLVLASDAYNLLQLDLVLLNAACHIFLLSVEEIDLGCLNLIDHD